MEPSPTSSFAEVKDEGLQSFSPSNNSSLSLPEELTPDVDSPLDEGSDSDLDTSSPRKQKKLLASFDSVFTLFREVNPYLKSGFRRPNVCWASAVQSVTQVHNETINIWIHLVAGLYHTVLLFVEEYHPMMWAALLTGAVCFYLSAAYHTFRYMSPMAFQWWLKVDHFGCVVFIAGSNLTWLQIIYSCQSDLRRFYSSFVLMGAASTLIIPLLPIKTRVWLAALLHYKLYDLAEPFLVLTAFASAAGILHHLYLRGMDPIGKHFFFEVSLYSMGFLVFLSKVPERLIPRVFDIWGNSHQLWHLFIVLSDLWHIECVRYYAWHWNPDC
eukprot:EG_transcript_12458